MACPYCGSSTGIMSFYRDGGSRLYHPSCPVEPKYASTEARTWANPEFKPLGQR